MLLVCGKSVTIRLDVVYWAAQALLLQASGKAAAANYTFDPSPFVFIELPRVVSFAII